MEQCETCQKAFYKNHTEKHATDGAAVNSVGSRASFHGLNLTLQLASSIDLGPVKNLSVPQFPKIMGIKYDLSHLMAVKI